MDHADRNEHDLHGVVDHQLVGDEFGTALKRLPIDPDAATRRAAYAQQREALLALRHGLPLSLPTPALAGLQDELHAAVQRQEQMRLTMALGGAVAVIALIGYASWPAPANEARSGAAA